MKLEITRLLPIKLLLSNAVEKRDGFLSRKILEKFGLSLVILLAIPIMPVQGQIVPDESLNTDVEQQGASQLKIDGGAREGNNLFHSFETFSIPEGIEAVFENASDIQNIFTRVTGSEASAINGILKTQGGANFFLINKNGIVFGENARLDVGGSFVATTANSIKFADGTEFATSAAEEQPILTISVPIGLQFDGDPGEIAVDGSGHQIAPSNGFSPSNIDLDKLSGFSVNSGKTLALIGGNINLDGGLINVNSGQIEIVSVDNGIVEILQKRRQLNFNYTNTIGRDVVISNKAFLYAAEQENFENQNPPETAIAIKGKNITISNGSYLLIQNQDNVLGNLRIDASDSINIENPSSDGTFPSAVTTQALSVGIGSKIELFASNISFKNGVSVAANNFGDATAGGVEINASQKLKFRGDLPQNNVIVGSGSFGKGKAGDVKVSTPLFSLVGASGITSSSFLDGTGAEVNIQAETVTLTGNSTSNPFITSPSFGSGNGGNILVNTTRLVIKDGGTINSSAAATGTAGDINIDASESVELIGKNDESTRIQSSVAILDERFRNVIGAPDIPSAQAGNLAIKTPILSLDKSAFIGVENQGLGNAGNLTIDVEKVNLLEAGRITASSASGTGGNINLNADQLQIDENSSITATAGKNGDGGNININTNSLIAKKNSEITANAFEGRGGKITIKATEGLFLFDSPESIFSASSQLGIDGTVKIETPDINLQPEVEQLILTLFDTQEEIANSCLAQNSSRSSFTVSSNNHSPKNPDSNYSDLNYSLTGIGSRTNIRRQTREIRENALLPAEKITTTPDGRVFLVAAPQSLASYGCE